MTVVFSDGLKVLHLHSHVVWKRWGMSSQLQGFARRLGTSVLYRLDLDADMAELVGCLMEYCYTGEVDKLESLTRYQIEMIGKIKETTIYSVAALVLGQQVVLDPHLISWRQQHLHPDNPTKPSPNTGKVQPMDVYSQYYQQHAFTPFTASDL